MQHRITSAIALGLLVVIGRVAPVWAQDVDEASRAAARTLGREGIEAYNNKNYPTALANLERAFRVVKAPSLALWSARALEKNGKLVEAAERYLEATRLPTSSGDQATQEQARLNAAKEREALLSRLPTLTIEVDPDVQEVRVDDVVLPAAVLGIRRPTNPGSHTVTAKRGDVRKSESIVLKEGENQTLRLELPQAATSESTGSAAGPKSVRHSDTPGDGAKPAVARGRTQRIVGWSALAVGGAGVAVGTIAGILVIAKHGSNEVSNSCVGARCPTSMQSTVDGFNLARNVSSIGFIVGAVGLGTGIGLLLTSPRDPNKQTGRLEPWIGVGSVGVRGGF